MHVPGHVDLRQDGHEAPGCISHDLGQVGLGEKAAVRGAVLAPLLVVAGRRLAPPRAHLGQPRVAVDLYPPALVVGQVEVEHVQLVEAGEVDQPQDEVLGKEMPGDVQVHAPPGKAGGVVDLHPVHVDAGDRPRAGAERSSAGREQLA